MSYLSILKLFFLFEKNHEQIKKWQNIALCNLYKENLSSVLKIFSMSTKIHTDQICTDN